MACKSVPQGALGSRGEGGGGPQGESGLRPCFPLSLPSFGSSCLCLSGCSFSVPASCAETVGRVGGRTLALARGPGAAQVLF